jgi:hypothetical protein
VLGTKCRSSLLAPGPAISRSSRRAGEQAYLRDQSQNRESARHYRSPGIAVAFRRGDRMSRSLPKLALFGPRAMSALRSLSRDKRTYRGLALSVANDPSWTSGRSPFWGADQLGSFSPARTAKPEIGPTLAERQSDAAPRHDCLVGNDAELTTLRCDKLMMLALRVLSGRARGARLSVGGVGHSRVNTPALRPN